jgi:lipopolysaccharide export system protein LptA
MPLERIFIHRLIRLLRVAVPILLAALIAIPAWNYVSRRTQKPQLQRAEDLPNNLAARTEGFTFSRTEGGKTLFTIHARTNIGFKDSKYVGEDVDVTVYGMTENESTRRIRARSCSYDQETGDIRFAGDVEFQFDEETQGHTQELSYNHRDRIVTSSQRTVIEQGGSATGEGDKLEYAMNTGLLKLDRNVHIQTTANTRLETESALFQRKENWATLSGGVFLKSDTGWIRGSAGRADFEPETYKLKTVVLDGDVTGETRAQNNQDAWKMRAARVEAMISPNGKPERVKARGKVEVEKLPSDSRQALLGDEIDATLDAAGRVDFLEARQDAQMILGADQTLRSSRIRTTPAGSVETAGNSVLQMADSTVEGRDFYIQQGDIVRFSTARRANLRSGERQSSADRTEAHFDSRTNTLLELVQTGNFQFRDEQFEGLAQKARFEEGGSVVTLDGSPVVTSSQMHLDAGQIRLNLSNNSFIALKNVNTLTKSAGEPALVKATRAEGTGDAILYTDNVQLWRGNAYIKAGRLEISSRANQLHAQGSVQSNFDGIRAVSNKLDYDDGQGIAHYEGNVRAQKQGMVLETSDMTVKRRQNDVAEIAAIGGVAVQRGEQRGTGEQAVYDAAADTVTLTGNNAEVHDKEHGTVEGARLVMKTNGETIVVEGGAGKRTVTKHTVK